MKILFVNACVRKESRTRGLAERVLEKLQMENDRVEEIRVSEVDAIRDEAFIVSRNGASEAMDFSASAYAPARQFAEADMIVIAAPYWDLSFPAILKAYFEQINVVGLTFEYTEDGKPRGLCKAKKLIYVTTAGGPILSDDYGYGYVKSLAQAFYGIPEVCEIKAEGLDVFGADVEKLLDNAFFEFWKQGAVE